MNKLDYRLKISYSETPNYKYPSLSLYNHGQKAISLPLELLSPPPTARQYYGCISFGKKIYHYHSRNLNEFIKSLFKIPLFNTLEKIERKALSKYFSLPENKSFIFPFLQSLLDFVNQHKIFLKAKNQRLLVQVDTTIKTHVYFTIMKGFIKNPLVYDPLSKMMPQEKELLKANYNNLTKSFENILFDMIKPFLNSLGRFDENCFVLPEILFPMRSELSNVEENACHLQSITGQALGKTPFLITLFKNYLNFLTERLKTTRHSIAAKQSSSIAKARNKMIRSVFSLLKDRNCILDLNKTVLFLGKAVAKITLSIQTDQERQTSRLFGTQMLEGTTPIYAFKTLNVAHLEFTNANFKSSLAFSLDSLSEDEQQMLSIHLDDQSFELWQYYFSLFACEKSYEFFKKTEVILELLDKKTLTLTFDQFVYYLEDSTLSTFNEGKIQIKNLLSLSLDEFMDGHVVSVGNQIFNTQEAIKYAFLKGKKNSLFFSVNPKDAYTQSLIQNCENKIWKIQLTVLEENSLESVEWSLVSFKRLYLLWKLNKINGKTLIEENGISIPIEGESTYHLLYTLEQPLELFIPEILTATGRSDQLRQTDLMSVKRVLAKPFIPNMQRLDKLLASKNIAYLQAIIKNIDSRANLQIFLVNLFQFMDLHDKNIGFSPVNRKSNIASALFKIPALSQDFFDFQDILEWYSVGKIDKNTIVQSKGSYFYSGSISESLELMHCLETRWQIHLFDLDLVSGEGDELALYRYQETDSDSISSMIPLRNHLFRIEELAFRPLKQDEIEEIKNALFQSITDDNTKTAYPWRWIKKSDHPKLQSLLEPILEKDEFSTSFYKGDLPFALLRENFAKELSDLKKNRSFWNEFEKILLSYGESGWFKKYTITSSDCDNHEYVSLETIAKKHAIPPQTLAILNPFLNPFKVPVGTNIVIRPSLLSDSIVAEKQRYQFSRALFPNESLKTTKARKQRVSSILEYLKYYETLISFELEKNNNDSTFYFFKTLLDNPITPLSSLQRKRFSKMLSKDDFPNFLEKLCKEYAPNQFRLACVMYPLLADFYEIMKLHPDVLKANKDTQNKIIFLFLGSYKHNIGTIFETLLEYYKKPSKERKFILEIENRFKVSKAKEDFFFIDLSP